MTNQLYERAASEGKNPMYYIYEYFGIQKDCKYFVETGTNFGGSVEVALELGFEKVLSCEFMQDRYEYCMNKFQADDNVFLWNGLSIDALPEIISNLDKRSLFWLDAHAEGGGVPTFEELDIIKSSNIKTHNILIDDIPQYFPNVIEELKQKILEINPEYKFIDFKTNHGADCDVLGAYVEES